MAEVSIYVDKIKYVHFMFVSYQHVHYFKLNVTFQEKMYAFIFTDSTEITRGLKQVVV